MTGYTRRSATHAEASGQDREVDVAVLERARDYDELADALGVDRDSARSYAREVVEQMVPAKVRSPARDRREQIVDYLFGEQTLRERRRTRSALRASSTDRAWAEEARLSLALVTQSPLPAIPEPEPAAGSPGGSRAGAVPEIVFSGVRIRRSGDPTLPRQLDNRTRLLLTVLGLAMVLGGFVLLVSSLGKGSSRATAARRGRGRGHATGQAHRRPTVVNDRFQLTPTGSQKHATGFGAVVTQHGMAELLLQARGVHANHQGTSYAVWLYNRAGDFELLGLVSPPVGPSGTFSSGTLLPDDAVRFHTLLITLESAAAPVRPGVRVLSAPVRAP